MNPIVKKEFTLISAEGTNYKKELNAIPCKEGSVMAKVAGYMHQHFPSLVAKVEINNHENQINKTTNKLDVSNQTEHYYVLTSSLQSPTDTMAKLCEAFANKVKILVLKLKEQMPAAKEEKAQKAEIRELSANLRKNFKTLEKIKKHGHPNTIAKLEAEINLGCKFLLFRIGNSKNPQAMVRQLQINPENEPIRKWMGERRDNEICIGIYPTTSFGFDMDRMEETAKGATDNWLKNAPPPFSDALEWCSETAKTLAASNPGDFRPQVSEALVDGCMRLLDEVEESDDPKKKALITDLMKGEKKELLEFMRKDEVLSAKLDGLIEAEKSVENFKKEIKNFDDFIGKIMPKPTEKKKSAFMTEVGRKITKIRSLYVARKCRNLLREIQADPHGKFNALMDAECSNIQIYIQLLKGKPEKNPAVTQEFAHISNAKEINDTSKKRFEEWTKFSDTSEF